MIEGKSTETKTSPSQSLQDLTNKWESRHICLENYVLVWYLPFKIFRKLKIRPDSSTGLLVRFLLVGLTLLVIPIIISGATHSPLNTGLVWKWLIIAFGFSAITLNYPLYKHGSIEISALYGSIQEESGINRMIVWDQRYFRIGLSFPVGVLFAIIALISIMNGMEYTGTAGNQFGTLALFAILAYQVGENTFNSMLVSIEPFYWTSYRFDLYYISPIQTISLQRAIQGYDLVVFLNSIFMTMFIAGSAFLLSGTPYSINGVLLALLIIAYLVIGILFFLPRLAIQRMIKAAKNRSLLPLQNKLVKLYANYGGLSDVECEDLHRTEEIYTKIYSSSDNLLPLGSIGKVVGNLLLPTVTFFLAIAAETYLSLLLEQLIK